MDAFLDAALSASASSPHVQFAAFFIVGVAVAWLIGRAGRPPAWSPALAIMGVCGAWIGAETSCLVGQVDRGGPTAFIAALLGAIALTYAWRRRHPEPSGPPERIALGRISA